MLLNSGDVIQPRPFDERPKTFHCVGMYPTRSQMTPVHRFMLHLFTISL